ncbi:MAG: hypothetical protein JNG84_05135 [Archangium sp.]|nr:hypothetical protein [Archangium sp.]
MRFSVGMLVVGLAVSCGGGATSSTACDVMTCSGCCDALGACQPGDQLAACGTVGGLCSACADSQRCAGGLCVAGEEFDGGSGGGSTGGGAGGGGGTTSSCANITGDRQTQVCLRWRCDRAELSEGAWNGNVAACTAGDMTAAGRANALKVLNTYRFIADLPPVITSATRDQAAQECALMQDAANALSHSPVPGAPCYTASGADAAGNSNISSGQAVRSIDMYMSDYGNATTMGHRRWFLSNQLGPVGIGGTSGASCHWVIGGSGTATKRFAAWPPPGPVPLQAIAIPTVGAGNSCDKTGWTVQTYATADNLANASVTVTDNGVSAPVTVTSLGANYGSRFAIRFVPMGWVSQAGHSYAVTVTAPALTVPISYTVDVVACP